MVKAECRFIKINKSLSLKTVLCPRKVLGICLSEVVQTMPWFVCHLNFGIICELLLNTHMASWNLFVKHCYAPINVKPQGGQTQENFTF